jgi:hypothetical protein
MVNKQKNSDNPIRNTSGCLDLTAHDAIENVAKAEDRRRKIFGLIYRIAELCDFYIEELVIKDNVTGKTWR